uniref:Uncharacterized protein n=1 Tax=Ailuropoda melanoleuca TaxID=9646 RepID=A0A7N5JX86_AILME
MVSECRGGGEGEARGAELQSSWPQCFPPPHPCCPDVELDLQRSVQAVLRELSAQAPALQSNQGMWRWSLHKKVERDPGKSPVLVRILLRELEKVGSRASGRQVEGGGGREKPSQLGPQSHQCCIPQALVLHGPPA